MMNRRVRLRVEFLKITFRTSVSLKSFPPLQRGALPDNDAGVLREIIHLKSSIFRYVLRSSAPSHALFFSSGAWLSGGFCRASKKIGNARVGDYGWW